MYTSTNKYQNIIVLTFVRIKLKAKTKKKQKKISNLPEQNVGGGTYGVMYGALVAESCRDPGKRKIKGCWHATGTLRNKKKKHNKRNCNATKNKANRDRTE